MVRREFSPSFRTTLAAARQIDARIRCSLPPGGMGDVVAAVLPKSDGTLAHELVPVDKCQLFLTGYISGYLNAIQNRGR
jgi:hypothetical protein